MTNEKDGGGIQHARERAESNGLLPIRDDWKLVCKDCQSEYPNAFVVGPCPKCGSARAGGKPPSYRASGYVGPTPDTDEVTGDSLIQLRESVGITKKQLAEKMGVEPSTVHFWEQSHFQPNEENKRRLADVFQLGGEQDE